MSKDRISWNWWFEIFQTLQYWPTIWFFKFFCHLKIEGQENLKGFEDSPLIIVSNHGSLLDPPLVAAVMPRKKWYFYPIGFFPIIFAAYEDYCKWGNRKFRFPINYFVTAYVRLNGSVMVKDVSNGHTNGLRTARDLVNMFGNIEHILSLGGRICIFPEGQRSPDGKLGEIKRGVVRIHKSSNYKHSKVPILPIAIIGGWKISSKEFFGRKRHIVVRIGHPFSLGKDDSFYPSGGEHIRSEIQNLLDGK